MNIAGGTHHAFYNRGEAFCMLNDQAIAANYILNKGFANRVMIIDLRCSSRKWNCSII